MLTITVIKTISISIDGRNIYIYTIIHINIKTIFNFININTPSLNINCLNSFFRRKKCMDNLSPYT